MKAILFLLFSFIAFQSFSQEKHITLNVQQKPLYEVFASITEQSGVRFSYNSQLLNENQKITLKVEKQPLSKVLSQILPQTVTYKLVGKHIILSAYTPPSVVEILAKDTAVRAVVVVDTFARGQAPLLDTLAGRSITETEIITDTTSLIISADTTFSEKKSNSDNGTLTTVCLNSKQTIKEKIMNTKIAAFCVGLFTASTSVVAQVAGNSDSTATTTSVTESIKTIPFQATFVYPLGTNGVQSFNNEYSFSVNILVGNTGKVNGAEFASLVNVNKYSVTGVQFAGLANVTGISGFAQSSKAVQFAGVVNYNSKGNSEQFAGTVNVGDSAHIQAAGVVNFARSKSDVQFAGIANATKETDFQVAGIANTAKSSNTQIAGIANASNVSKAQIAGIVNSTKTTNLQIAGITNIAEESKCQISGIVNVTKQGGFQLGLVNVRDTADGVSVGLINIVRKGGLMELEIGGGEAMHTALSFRSGSEKLYGIISLGINFNDEFFAVGAGLGTEISLSEKIGLNLEAVQNSLYNNDFEDYRYGELTQLRTTLNFAPIKQLKLYAGPTFNFLSSEVDNRVFTPPYSIWDWRSGNWQAEAWVGFTAGFRFCF